MSNSSCAVIWKHLPNVVGNSLLILLHLINGGILVIGIPSYFTHMGCCNVPVFGVFIPCSQYTCTVFIYLYTTLIICLDQRLFICYLGFELLVLGKLHYLCKHLLYCNYYFITLVFYYNPRHLYIMCDFVHICHVLCKQMKYLRAPL